MARRAHTAWRMFTGSAALTLALALAACGSDASPETTPIAVTQPTSVASAPVQTTQTPATTVIASQPPSPTPPVAPALTSTVPVATPTQVPATAEPTATTASSTPLSPATTIEVDASRLADEAMEFLQVLTLDHSPRGSGEDQERNAAEFLASEFEALGYRVQLQPFTVDVEAADVTVGADEDFPAIPLTLSGTGAASGTLVSVGKARDGDLPSGLAGKIALIQRGEITFGEKVGRVADAGASGAIVYNNVEGLFRGTLTEQGQIPVVSISRKDGESILSTMAGGDVESSVSVVFETRDTQNVVAEKPGTAAEERVVILGGHYDTVPGVPGANDNGSGTATLMTVARELAETSHRLTLRFIAFGSEELGLRGSQFYVESLGLGERVDIEMMLNFDALGTGPVVGILGDTELVTSILRVGEQAGIESELRPSLERGTSSDHATFQAAGIPAAFFLADDFSRIHTPQDRVEFVRPELMGNSAALAILLLQTLATP